MEPIYLDHHATTPCDPRVVEAMLPYFSQEFGNAASRSHGFGFRAQRAVERARGQLATLLGCSPKEVILTSGATESDNLAILGVARAAGQGHVITVATEHKAVLDPVARLQHEGFQATVLPVDAEGLVSVAQVEAALRADTVLVSVMAANNEIGVLQPWAEIGALCRERGVLFHCDAAQAVGKLPLQASDADLLSVSAHKMYGPKGVGALIVRRGRPRVRLEPILFGGGHERGLRSGTLAVPLIVGFGQAAVVASEALQAGEPVRIGALRDRLWQGLAGIPGVHRNGSASQRLPHNLHVSFEGIEAEALMMGMREVAVSSGSACTSATLEPSHVLRALGIDPELAHGSLRFGLGRSTTSAQIDHVVARVREKVAALRVLMGELGV